MANHVSALKRARQSTKRRLRNRMRTTAVRSAIKNVNAAVAAGDKKAADEALKIAVPLIARSGQRGVIHRKQASRRVSRLVASIKAISA